MPSMLVYAGTLCRRVSEICRNNVQIAGLLSSVLDRGYLSRQYHLPVPPGKSDLAIQRQPSASAGPARDWRKPGASDFVSAWHPMAQLRIRFRALAGASRSSCARRQWQNASTETHRRAQKDRGRATRAPLRSSVSFCALLWFDHGFHGSHGLISRLDSAIRAIGVIRGPNRRGSRRGSSPDANRQPGRKPDDHPDAKLRYGSSPQAVATNRFTVQYEATRTHPDANSRNTLLGRGAAVARGQNR